jgi:DNA-binding CsgD family transcriptional regulator
LQVKHGLLEITPAEQLVLDQLLLGKTNAEIALALNRSSRTVKFHLRNIFKKRGVDGREQLIVSESNYRAGMLPRGRIA